jgi:hypothetical protein
MIIPRKRGAKTTGGTSTHFIANPMSRPFSRALMKQRRQNTRITEPVRNSEDEAGRVDDEAFVQGFVEGALEVWDAVESQI